VAVLCTLTWPLCTPSCSQVVLPLWRQQRPSLLVEAAEVVAAEGEGEKVFPATAAPASGPQPATFGAPGEPLVVLRLTGYVRGAGLSANQAVTLPGECLAHGFLKTAPTAIVALPLGFDLYPAVLG
jgi:hypothetical protein